MRILDPDEFIAAESIDVGRIQPDGLPPSVGFIVHVPGGRSVVVGVHPDRIDEFVASVREVQAKLPTAEGAD